MSSYLYFGTFCEPGLRHELAFDAYSIGRGKRAAEPNILNVKALYYSENGVLLLEEMLDCLSPVCELKAVDSRVLVLLKITYTQLLPSNIYGFITNTRTGEGTSYPLNAAIGWPETDTWYNRAVMPIGKPPENWENYLYIANPSRWSAMKIQIRYYCEGEYKSKSYNLGPKHSLQISLKEEANALGVRRGVDAIAVISRNKSIAYLSGRNVNSGSISFLEHLVTLPRTNIKLDKAKPWNDLKEADGDIADQIICYCNGKTLGNLLDGSLGTDTGNYCTGCRDDIRTIKKFIKFNPELSVKPTELIKAITGNNSE